MSRATPSRNLTASVPPVEQALLPPIDYDNFERVDFDDGEDRMDTRPCAVGGSALCLSSAAAPKQQRPPKSSRELNRLSCVNNNFHRWSRPHLFRDDVVAGETNIILGNEGGSNGGVGARMASGHSSITFDFPRVFQKYKSRFCRQIGFKFQEVRHSKSVMETSIGGGL